jgi:arginine repressor
MAKKKVNKSALIREYFKNNPTAGLTEIARAISEQGHPVSPAHVNQALNGLRKKRKKGRGRPIASASKRAATSSSSNRAMDQLSLAAEFCKACGGVDIAIDVLNSLKQIASKL